MSRPRNLRIIEQLGIRNFLCLSLSLAMCVCVRACARKGSKFRRKKINYLLIIGKGNKLALTMAYGMGNLLSYLSIQTILKSLMNTIILTRSKISNFQVFIAI